MLGPDYTRRCNTKQSRGVREIKFMHADFARLRAAEHAAVETISWPVIKEDLPEHQRTASAISIGLPKQPSGVAAYAADAGSPARSAMAV
jgi:hypothetical protein